MLSTTRRAVLANAKSIRVGAVLNPRFKTTDTRPLSPHVVNGQIKSFESMSIVLIVQIFHLFVMFYRLFILSPSLPSRQSPTESVECLLELVSFFFKFLMFQTKHVINVLKLDARYLICVGAYGLGLISLFGGDVNCLLDATKDLLVCAQDVYIVLDLRIHLPMTATRKSIHLLTKFIFICRVLRLVLL